MPYKGTPEEKREQRRRYKRSHKDHVNVYKRGYLKRNHKLRRTRRWKEQGIVGFNWDAYEQMYASQNGRCAICGTPAPAHTRSGLFVDHDHVTKRVRGLLCRRCNTGIGQFNDNPVLIHSALQYLAGL